MIVDVGIVVPLTWGVISGGSGSYAISYLALTFVWSGGLVLWREHWPKPYLALTTFTPAYFLPYAIWSNFEDFILRYAFAFIATLFGTMSINAFSPQKL